MYLIQVALDLTINKSFKFQDAKESECDIINSDYMIGKRKVCLV